MGGMANAPAKKRGNKGKEEKREVQMETKKEENSQYTRVPKSEVLKKMKKERNVVNTEE